VTANIAEGVVKRGQREFRRFLDIAVGSFTELRYVAHLAGDLGYLPESDWEKLELERNNAGKLLWRLYESVAKRSTP
jgi:four helix bundle protein